MARGFPTGSRVRYPPPLLALAPFREDSDTWEAPGRAGGGLRTVDLLPAAERHAIGLSVTIGLGLAAIAVALGITGDPLLAAGALGIGAAILVRGYVRRRAETVRLAQLLAGQTRILEMVATGAALVEVLDALCRVVEKQVSGLLCSVLLLEGDRLRDGAGPSLAEGYRRGVDGATIGPEV